MTPGRLPRATPRRRWWTVVPALAIVVLLGCTTAAPPATQAPPPTEEPTTEPTEEPTAEPTSREPVALKFATNSEIDEGELVLLYAVDSLAEHDITVELVELADTDLAAAAVVSGQVDFTSINPPALVAANAAGADLRNFVTGENNAWVLATPTSITDASALGDGNLAHHGTGISKALALYTVEKYGIEPEVLSVPGGTARAAALATGELDSTVIQFGQLESLKAQHPDEFHALLVYEDELPGVLKSDNYVAKRATLEGDPETWTLVTEAIIAANRFATEDPEAFADFAVTVLPNADRDAVLEGVRLNAENGVYPIDGGITEEGFTRLVDFYVEYELIDPAHVRPFEELATLDYIEQALDRLGS